MTASMLKKIRNLGEERLSEVLNDLLKNEQFSAALSRAMTRTQAFKSQLDKNVASALSLVNQPTREDFDRLRKQLRNLDRKIDDLTEQLEEMQAAQKKAAKRPAKSNPDTAGA